MNWNCVFIMGDIGSMARWFLSDTAELYEGRVDPRVGSGRVCAVLVKIRNCLLVTFYIVYCIKYFMWLKIIIRMYYR